MPRWVKYGIISPNAVSWEREPSRIIPLDSQLAFGETVRF